MWSAYPGTLAGRRMHRARRARAGPEEGPSRARAGCAGIGKSAAASSNPSPQQTLVLFGRSHRRYRQTRCARSCPSHRHCEMMGSLTSAELSLPSPARVLKTYRKLSRRRHGRSAASRVKWLAGASMASQSASSADQLFERGADFGRTWRQPREPRR
jgi:hypothetical protein